MCLAPATDVQRGSLLARSLARRQLRFRGLVLVLLVALGVACKGRPDPTPWCSDTSTFDAGRPPANLGDGGAVLGDPNAPTYFRDAKPIADAKCVRCHTTGGIAPFSLERWDDFYRRIDVVRHAVATRHMPPWHAVRCCSEYHADASLTEAELGRFIQWLDLGAPLGDARDDRPVPPFGGLSRADVTLAMPAPYTPAPKPGATDENRCFLLGWPLAAVKSITGLNPVPGERSIVHHILIGVLSGDSLEDAREIDGKDGRPGFDCMKLRGMGVRDFTVLGGSMLGSDYPAGLGREIKPGSTVLLNIHYSTANAPPKPDLTKIQFRVDDHANSFEGLGVANLAWLVGDGMRIEAGEKDAVFHYAYEPTLFTRGKTVYLRSVTPHMHAFATKIVVRVIREDGRRECLLEIPRWHFGWEQPFWFAQPKVLRPGDEIYVECHFDNSSSHQPSGQSTPRDIGWGDNNQDMCAAFVNFTWSAQ
jgi:hypothetical protein